MIDNLSAQFLNLRCKSKSTKIDSANATSESLKIEVLETKGWNCLNKAKTII